MTAFVTSKEPSVCLTTSVATLLIPRPCPKADNAERFSVMSFANSHYEELLEEIIGQEAKEQFTPTNHKEPRSELSEERIKKALHLCHGNREAAAGQLGISRSTLWRKMKELGIEAVYKEKS